MRESSREKNEAFNTAFMHVSHNIWSDGMTSFGRLTYVWLNSYSAGSFHTNHNTTERSLFLFFSVFLSSFSSLKRKN